MRVWGANVLVHLQMTSLAIEVIWPWGWGWATGLHPRDMHVGRLSSWVHITRAHGKGVIA